MRAPDDANPARTIDELDAAICTLAANLNAETHRLLMLVREFDDRMGWAKWSFRSCAEWLAWRCGRFPRLRPGDCADGAHLGSEVGGAAGDDLYCSLRLPASFRARTPR
jgi:hypothetical protein